MDKLIALAAAALVVAVPATAYPCMNGVLLVGDEEIRELERAERLLVAGKHQAALRAIGDFEWAEDYEGLRANAFRQRLRLVDATAKLRLLAQHRPIDLESAHTCTTSTA